MATHPYVRMDVMDTTAKRDAALQWQGTLQPFADPEDLLAEVPEWPRYMTLEPGRLALDGSFVPMPDDLGEERWGVFGGTLSGADGALASPMVLDWTFGGPHTAVGLTFHFDPAGDWAGDMLVQWFDGRGVELARMRVAPTAHEWFLARRVNRFARLVVTVYATAKPHRYLKVAGVEFGARRRFGPKEIAEARIIEQLDPAAGELPAGELELRVHAPGGDFALLNPQGLTGGLQQRQRFMAYLEREGLREQMGVYYLSEWVAESEQRTVFRAVDAVGLLEAAAFEGGIYDTTAAALCAEILGGVCEYELDGALGAERVAGWLPEGTRRGALAQLCLALGAVADTTRDGRVKLYRAGRRPGVYIQYARKVLGASSLEVKPLVTAVRVTGHSWAPGTAAERLFSGALSAGRHTVRFAGPAAGYTLSGEGAGRAELVRRHANLVVVAMQQAGTLEIWGVPYTHTQVVVEREAEDLPPDAAENLLEVDGATLVGPGLAGVVCDRLLDYHARRYRQTFRLLPGGERLADMVQVQSLGGQSLRGGIERMEIDLAGGFVADVVVSGVQVDAEWTYHCGELDAGLGGMV